MVVVEDLAIPMPKERSEGIAMGPVTLDTQVRIEGLPVMDLHASNVPGDPNDGVQVWISPREESRETHGWHGDGSQ